MKTVVNGKIFTALARARNTRAMTYSVVQFCVRGRACCSLVSVRRRMIVAVCFSFEKVLFYHVLYTFCQGCKA